MRQEFLVHAVGVCVRSLEKITQNPAASKMHSTRPPKTQHEDRDQLETACNEINSTS